MIEAIRIIKKLQDHGFHALLVGGCVRDKLLNTKPKDYDIVTNAPMEDTCKLFKETKIIGKAFGVVLVSKAYEVAQFRKDFVNGDVEALDPTLPLDDLIKHDASRRDYTQNAIYFDPISDKLYDPEGGVDDFLERRLNTVGKPYDRLMEDPLRLLRGFRFAFKYNMRLPYGAIQPDILQALSELPKERIFMETTKILMNLNSWNIDLFEDLLVVLASCVSPLLKEYRFTEQSPKWHFEGNLMKHTFGALKQLRRVNEVTVWATFLHDLGKVETTVFKDGEITSKLHEHVGENLAKELLLGLKCSTEFINEVTYIVGNHMRIKHVDQMKKSKVIACMVHPYYDNLKEVSCADSNSSMGNLAWFHFLNEFKLPEESKIQPLVTGKTLIDLGYNPGPEFRDLLSIALEYQLDEGLNKCEILKRMNLTV